jgi:hypothetical protein
MALFVVATVSLNSSVHDTRLRNSLSPLVTGLLPAPSMYAANNRSETTNLYMFRRSVFVRESVLVFPIAPYSSSWLSMALAGMHVRNSDTICPAYRSCVLYVFHLCGSGSIVNQFSQQQFCVHAIGCPNTIVCPYLANPYQFGAQYEGSSPVEEWDSLYSLHTCACCVILSCDSYVWLHVQGAIGRTDGSWLNVQGAIW